MVTLLLNLEPQCFSNGRVEMFENMLAVCFILSRTKFSLHLTLPSVFFIFYRVVVTDHKALLVLAL